jgi:hypothetical protein
LALGLNFISPFLVDRFPRNKYLAVGMFGCISCLIVEAALVANFAESDNVPAMKAAVAVLFIFVIFIALFLEGEL